MKSPEPRGSNPQGGKPRYRWTPSARGRADRRSGAREERIELVERADSEIPMGEEDVDHYLADYAGQDKSSSLNTQTNRLQRFGEEFEGHSPKLSRAELNQWVSGEHRWFGLMVAPSALTGGRNGAPAVQRG